MDFGAVSIPVGAAILGSVFSAGATAVGAYAASEAAEAQATADRQRGIVEQKWAERRAQEETAAAQRNALSQARQRNLAQSRLIALAGASGGKVDDPTVLDLWGDIEGEGQYNMATTLAGGQQKAAGLQFQGDMGRWVADSNAAIKEASATPTLIGGLLSAGGQGMTGLSRMGARYRSPSSGGGYRYG